MIALYSRLFRMRKPRWRAVITLHLKRIRLFYSLIDGGIRKSYYTFESTEGHLIDLVYNEDELTWHKKPGTWYNQFELSAVLALILKENDQPSRAHRVIPLRLGLVPGQEIKPDSEATGMPLSYRMQPYRFQGESVMSAQVINVPSRKLEITPLGKQLHYVVQSDTGIYYHLMFEQDSSDWLMVKTVDEHIIRY